MTKNCHFFLNNLPFTCTKIWNGKISIKSKLSLKSLKSKERQTKTNAENRKKSKKEPKKFKAKAVSPNPNHRLLANNKENKRMICLVEPGQSIANRKKRNERTKLSLKTLKSRRKKRNQMMMTSCDLCL